MCTGDETDTREGEHEEERLVLHGRWLPFDDELAERPVADDTPEVPGELEGVGRYEHAEPWQKQERGGSAERRTHAPAEMPKGQRHPAQRHEPGAEHDRAMHVRPQHEQREDEEHTARAMTLVGKQERQHQREQQARRKLRT